MLHCRWCWCGRRWASGRPKPRLAMWARPVSLKEAATASPLSQTQEVKLPKVMARSTHYCNDCWCISSNSIYANPSFPFVTSPTNIVHICVLQFFLLFFCKRSTGIFEIFILNKAWSSNILQDSSPVAGNETESFCGI